ncbi:hypothetical protein D3C76_1224330 [compost metagenome]
MQTVNDDIASIINIGLSVGDTILNASFLANFPTINFSAIKAIKYIGHIARIACTNVSYCNPPVAIAIL